MTTERWKRISSEGSTIARVELDKETATFLAEKAKKEGKTKSQIMRDALKLLMQEEGDNMEMRGKLVQMSIQLEAEDAEWLKKLREKTGRSKTYWVREAIQMLRKRMEEEK